VRAPQLIKNKHRLLVTLLLMNAGAMEVRRGRGSLLCVQPAVHTHTHAFVVRRCHADRARTVRAV
jgi:hypothetical protein